MFTSLFEVLASGLSSDFFAGGLALGLIGSALAALRLIWAGAQALIVRLVRVDVTLDNRSSGCRDLWVWLRTNEVLRRTRRLQLSEAELDETPSLGPAEGTHWFWRGGALCRLTREMDRKARIGPGGHRLLETVHLSVYFGSVAQVTGWLAEGATLAQAEAVQQPQLHVLSDSWWEQIGPLQPRPLATVLADDDRVESLFADLQRFYDGCDWYYARGVPWRRGYLLHGPPGTGKSSLVRALATALKVDIAVVDLGGKTLTDDGLAESLARAPRRAILLMEDIDAIFDGREAKTDGGISFSGLLNAIDGVAAQEGRPLFMTTNHVSRLDPALIRPGRADRHVEMGLVQPETAGRLFERFFPGADAQRAAFVASLGSGPVSPSAIQGWLLAQAHDATAAARAHGLAAQPRPVAAE